MTAWIASLPQYDIAEIRSATDAWWQGIARHLKRHGLEDVPEALLRTDDDEAVWRRPEVLMTQTCGYPLMTELLDYLRPIATPVYDCEGCIGATYSSALLVREDEPSTALKDFQGRIAAVNNPNSHSGMNALRHSVAPIAQEGHFFGGIYWSGGHALSAAAVRDGKADIAAVDSVTLALLGEHLPAQLEGIRVLSWTAHAPSLPYATHIGTPEKIVMQLNAALMDAVADPDLASARAPLLLKDFQPCTVETYRTMIDFETAAIAQGYPKVA